MITNLKAAAIAIGIFLAAICFIYGAFIVLLKCGEIIALMIGWTLPSAGSYVACMLVWAIGAISILGISVRSVINVHKKHNHD